MKRTWVCHAVGERLPSGRLHPRSVFARELGSGREVAGGNPPFGRYEDVTLIAFPAHRVVETLNALGWATPRHVIDMYAEHRAATNGVISRESTADPRLEEACAVWDVPCRAHMTDTEAAASSHSEQHCRAVVDTVCHLLQVTPLDQPQALQRGQYAAAVAAIQERGIPVAPSLQSQAKQLRDQLWAIASEEYPQCFRKEKWRNDSASRWLRGLGIGRLATPTIDWCRRHSDSHVRRAGEIAKSLQKLEQMVRFSVDQDSRSHADLRPYAAVTGRNQPCNYVWEVAKHIIQPPSGKALAIIDYAQQEFGIAAHLSKDPAMVDDYISGDAYLNFGTRAGMCSGGNDDAAARNLLKQAVLPIMYGSSAHSLVRGQALAAETACKLVATFAQAYPRYRQWVLDARSRLAQVGMVSTSFGWRLNAPSECPNFSKLLRTAGNFPVQAHGTEMLWEACRRLHTAGIQICGTLHDAVMIEADEHAAEDVIRTAEAIMREASEAVIAAPLRTSTEAIRCGQQFRSQQQFWSSTVGLLSPTAAVCQ